MSAEPTIFTKIINREIPADIVYEDDQVIIVKDIHPETPVHLLGIPKLPIKDIHTLVAEENDPQLLWHLFHTLAETAEKLGVAKDGYRLITNVGENGGQSIPHLHVHLLAGTKLPLKVFNGDVA